MYERNHKRSIRNSTGKSEKDFGNARRNKVWQNLQYLDLVYSQTITREGKDADYLSFLAAVYQGLRNARFHRDTLEIWFILRGKTQQVGKPVLFRRQYRRVRIYRPTAKDKGSKKELLVYKRG